MKLDEKAFETHIAEWLTEHGGYDVWKLGTQSTDFDADCSTGPRRMRTSPTSSSTTLSFSAN